MPSVTVEDLPDNCQVTIIISELVDIDDPNPPAEMPDTGERENIWLVSTDAHK